MTPRFENVTITESLSPYTKLLFEAFDGSLPDEEFMKYFNDLGNSNSFRNIKKIPQ